MNESEIPENMKDQGVLNVDWMTKKGGNFGMRPGMWTFALGEIPEKVNTGYKRA